jgi:hypothetical protein
VPEKPVRGVQPPMRRRSAPRQGDSATGRLTRPAPADHRGRHGFPGGRPR